MLELFFRKLFMGFDILSFFLIFTKHIEAFLFIVFYCLKKWSLHPHEQLLKKHASHPISNQNIEISTFLAKK